MIFHYITKANLFFGRKWIGYLQLYLHHIQMDIWISSVSKLQKSSPTVLQFRSFQHEMSDSSPHFFAKNKAQPLFWLWPSIVL